MRIKDLPSTNSVSPADFIVVDQNPTNPVTRRATLASALGQNAQAEVLSAVSGVDTITATSAQAFTDYAAGQRFQFGTAGANTGAVTLAVNGLAAKAVVAVDGTALTAGALPAGTWVTVEYNGTAFTVLGYHVLRSSWGAGAVGNTPAGGIAATTVQGALNELDTEKISFTRLDDSDGSSLVGFLQAGTGAVTRTAQSKMRDLVSVKDFGAVGDGVTDDATAINNACTAVAALGGGEVMFGAGTFIVGSPIELADNVQLHGAGQKATTIKLKASANVNVIQKKFGAVGLGAGLFDLTIDGSDANNTNGGIYWAGASSGRGPSFTFERVTVTNCRPIASPPSGEYAAILTTGSTWGVARDLDVVSNQYAVGWWHKASDWQIDNLYLGPNGANYSTGTHSMIVQGGAGNLFASCYFGGNGGLAQVFFWGSSRNLLVNCINDNAWENAYRLVDLAGSGSNNNRFLGGQIRGASGKTNNTFPAVYIANSNGNIFSDVEWSGNAHTSSGNAANYGLQEAGTATGNYIVGGNVASNFLTNFVSLAGGSTTMVTSVFGWDSSDIQIASVKKRVNVTGPLDTGAPSASSVPLGRFNNGGAVSLWVASRGYQYAWMQAIQDDGSNNPKDLLINPLGGAVDIANGNVLVDGSVNKTIKFSFGTSNGSVATTLGSVGPTGSTAGNPQGWLRINVAGTDRYVPYW